MNAADAKDLVVRHYPKARSRQTSWGWWEIEGLTGMRARGGTEDETWIKASTFMAQER